MRTFYRTGLIATLFMLLSGCAGVNIGAPLTAIDEVSDDSGTTELILEPIDVWEQGDAGDAEQLTAADRTLYFRLRSTETFQKAWVRLGLFWNSRQDHIYMPIIIVGGPPVEIQKVKIEADKNSEALKPAKNFDFTPGKRPFDKELHAGVFMLSPNILSKIADAKDVYVTISTNRGALRVNLSVITGRSNSDLTNSAKYQFSEFYRRQQARQ